MVRTKNEKTVILETVFYKLENYAKNEKKYKDIIKDLEKIIEYKEDSNKTLKETIELQDKTIRILDETVNLLKKDTDSKIIRFLKKFI